MSRKIREGNKKYLVFHYVKNNAFLVQKLFEIVFGFLMKNEINVMNNKRFSTYHKLICKNESDKILGELHGMNLLIHNYDFY